MTNKKFKVAAMSMALTACVAAQPLIANAADEQINSNDENVNESQSEGESPASAPVAAASESSSNTEVKDEKKQDMLAPDEQLGEYSKPETDTDGNSTSEADITKDAPEQEQEPEIDGDSGDSGDTDGTDGTDGTDNTGNTDNTDNTDSGTGSEIKEQITIGESTLTETPGQSSTVVTPNPGAEPMPDPTKPPEVTTNPDGSTDIETSTVTPGTETTTTTASGEVNAESHTGEEISGDQIDLEKELGGTEPDWNTEKDAKFNGYNVDNVEPSEDGNSKTLTLTKTEHLEGQMGSEELAKFTNSTKIGHGDGTYDLVRTETYTDENGQQRTRTTTLHVKDNEVIVDTTITLSVTLEKGEHDVGSEDISHVVLPDHITVTATDEETGNTKNISAAELEQLMGNTTPTIDGTKKTYTVNKDGLEYTIEVDEGAFRNLTNAEIFEKLDGSKYEYDRATDKIYYIGNSEHAELTEEQNNALRRTLSYTVTVKETTKSKEETVSGKGEAEAAAKTEARNNAVKNALKELKLNDTQVQQALKDGTFDDDAHTFTYTLDGKTYTLNYTIDPTTTESSAPTSNAQGTIDTKEHTVTGTAQVITGTVSWTDIGSGSGKCSEISGKPWTKPDGATKVKTDHDGNKTITTYKVTSTDGKTVTTYVVTEEEVPLSDAEKNELAVRLAWEQLEKQTGKTRTELKADGYKIDNPIFTGSTKNISWTATQTTTSKTEEPVSDIIYVGGDKKWTIDEEAGTITVDGTTYTISQKNADSYTCDVIDVNNQKTTYTFTEKDGSTLTNDQIKDMLVNQLKDDFPDITAADIRLNDNGTTASYTKDGKTVTIDYSKLGKKLEVTKDEHHSNSTTVTITDGEDADAKFEEACKNLLEDIKTNILPTLDKDKGEELWIGNTHVTKDTTLTTDIMEYFTKAISSADMSNDEIIKALEDQARVARETDVKVNEGKKDKWGHNLEETLKNYYDGEKEGVYYVKPDGSTYLGDNDKVKWISGKYYYYDWDKGSLVELTQKTGQKDKYISHLDLASDSKLDLLPDEEGHVETTDCVLISKDLKLEWNYEADDLVKDRNNTTVSLEDEITFDSEDGKEGSGHYEYNRGSNYEKTLPTKSAYYKLTGTVVYDAVKDRDGNVEKYKNKYAAKLAYCTETGRAYNTVSDEDFAKYVVKVGDKYQVYTKSSQLEAYGYMTRDANTCVNQTYRNQHDEDDKPYYYIGGYDLMISKLVQVREGKIVGQTESNTKTITAPWSIRTTETKADGWLQLLKKTTTVSKNTDFGSGSGSTTNGNYSYTYTQDHANTLDSSVTGTGTGTYTSFRQLLTRIFTGNNTGYEDSGSFRYTYRTENDAVLTPVSKVTKVDKTAHITYDRTTVESRDVLIPGTETVHIDPDDDGGDEIIEEKDPDLPVLPGTPELPPVQDAKPDAPVLPADPALPAVQGAHALPQTGVNWLAAIGLALSGMTLMITGAFASLLGKNAKH